MKGNGDHLTRETFEQVLARAIELGELKRDGISEERARQIASELGVSSASWEQALAEFKDRSIETAAAQRADDVQEVEAPTTTRHWWIAMLSACAGLAFGTVDRWRGGLDLPAWGILLEIGVLFGVPFVLLLHHSRRGSGSGYQLDLAMWWSPFPLAFLIALGRVWGDPIFFCFASWSLTALGGAAIVWFTSLLRRLPPATSPIQ